MTRRSDGSTYTATIGSSTAIDGFKIYGSNNNDAGNRNIYFNNFTVANSGNYSSGGTVTSGWAYTGSGVLTVGNSTTLTLTSDGNTFTGGTTVDAGSTLQIGNGGGSGSLPGSVANNGAVTFNRTGDVTYNGTMSGSGVVNKQGSGALFLSSGNSYTGTTTISAGTLEAQHANALGTSAAGTTVASGAVLKLYHATGMTIANEALTLNGTGVGDGGSLLNTGGNNIWSGGVTLAGNTRINADNSGGVGNLTISGNISGGASVLYVGTQGSANIAFSGAVSGSGASAGSDHGNLTTSIFKDGGAALTLSGPSTFGGATLLVNGTILVGNNSAFGSGIVQVPWSSNATRTIASTDGTPRTLSNTLNIYNNLSLGATDRTGSLNFTGTVALGDTVGAETNRMITVAADNTHSFGTLTGNRNLVKQGAGTLNLSGASNTANGNLIVDNGIVSLEGGGVSFQAIEVGSGVAGDQSSNNATLRITSTSQAFSTGVRINSDGAAGSRTIDFANTAGTATLDSTVTLEKAATINVASGGTGNINGAVSAVSGPHLVTKTGAGTLRFNNSVAGPVTVNAGTLGGNATISGLVTLNSGGTLAPGNSVGTMNLSAGLALNSGSTVTMEINGPSAGQYDTINVTGGTLAYGGTLKLVFGYAAVGTETYNLFTRTGGAGFSGNFTSLDFSDNPGYAGTFNASNGALTLTAVPEPSTWALIGVGAAFVLWRLRRRTA